MATQERNEVKTMSNEKMFTIHDLALRWGVHENTVRKLIREKRLQAFKVGGRGSWRITAEEVKRHEESR